MATLRTRLDRLEGKRGTSFGKPDVIYLCGVDAVDRETGEVTVARKSAAWVNVGASYDYLIREDGETEAEFIERVDRMGSLGPSG